MKYRIILPVFLSAALAGIVIMTQRGESRIEVSSENPQKIVVTVEEPVTLPAEYRAMLTNADSLRKSWHFRDSKVIYEQLLTADNIDIETRKEIK